MQFEKLSKTVVIAGVVISAVAVLLQPGQIVTPAASPSVPTFERPTVERPAVAKAAKAAAKAAAPNTDPKPTQAPAPRQKPAVVPGKTMDSPAHFDRSLAPE